MMKARNREVIRISTGGGKGKERATERRRGTPGIHMCN